MGHLLRKKLQRLGAPSVTITAGDASRWWEAFRLLPRFTLVMLNACGTGASDKVNLGEIAVISGPRPHLIAVACRSLLAPI